MNIVMTESSRSVGGQESAVLLYANGLRARGHRVDLVLDPGSPIHRMAERQRLPVIPIPMRPANYGSALFAFSRLLRRCRPDIVHANSSRDSWMASVAARAIRSGPKIIRSRHISTPLKKSRLTRLLYQRLYDHVIVTGGEITRRALIERDGLAPDRVAAFPIGIDVSQFCPGAPGRNLKEELGLPADHHLVGIISYLRRYKGHRYFVEAAARISSQITNVTFVIVGEGPEERAIRSHIQELGLMNTVRLLGFREDLVDVFRSLDVFILPSVEGDTIPQALMQALAVGLPVLSTTVASIPDVVKDGETGLLVPPHDSVSLAERLGSLLQDEALRRTLGAKACRLVREQYSLEPGFRS